jgi:hypothetical protein
MTISRRVRKEWLRCADASATMRDISLVGARGFEPLTSSASRKRSPPELSARYEVCTTRRGPELNRCTGLCRPLPNHSATPPNERPGRSRARQGVYSGPAEVLHPAPLNPETTRGGQAEVEAECQARSLSRVRLGPDRRDHASPLGRRRHPGLHVRVVPLDLGSPDREAARGPLEERDVAPTNAGHRRWIHAGRTQRGGVGGRTVDPMASRVR